MERDMSPPVWCTILPRLEYSSHNMKEIHYDCVVRKMIEDGVIINIAYDILDKTNCMCDIGELDAWRKLGESIEHRIYFTVP